MKSNKRISHSTITCNHPPKNKTKQGFVKKTNIQKFKCKKCGRFFNEKSGSFFYYKHLSQHEIIHICKLISKGNSFREISKRQNHHIDTIRKYVDDFVIWHHFNRYELFGFLLDVCKLHPFEIVKFFSNIMERKRKKEIIVENAPLKSRGGKNYNISVYEFEETINIIMDNISKQNLITEIEKILKSDYLTLKMMKTRSFHEKIIQKTLKI